MVKLAIARRIAVTIALAVYSVAVWAMQLTAGRRALGVAGRAREGHPPPCLLPSRSRESAKRFTCRLHSTKLYGIVTPMLRGATEFLETPKPSKKFV